MTKCEQCGCLGSEWCMSCTVVSLAEYMEAHDVRFHGGHEETIEDMVCCPGGCNPLKPLPWEFL